MSVEEYGNILRALKKTHNFFLPPVSQTIQTTAIPFSDISIVCLISFTEKNFPICLLISWSFRVANYTLASFLSM